MMSLGIEGNTILTREYIPSKTDFGILYQCTRSLLNAEINLENRRC